MLTKFRNQIDDIDNKIIKLLSKRFQLVKKIGNYKIKNNLDIIQSKRKTQMMEDRINLGKQLGINKTFIKKFWKNIHDYSVFIQKKLK